METKAHNASYFTATEFLVLCALSGMQGISGIFRKEPQECSRQEVYYALHQLIRRGMVNEKKEVLPPVREMIAAIRKAKQVWMAYTRDGRTMKACLYPGEVSVVSEVSGPDENSIRLTALPREEVLPWLQEAQCLPSLEQTNLEERGVSPERLEAVCRTEALPEGEALSLACPVPEVLGLVQQFDPAQKKVVRRMFWLAEAEQDYLIIEEEEKRYSLAYQEEGAQRLLLSLMEDDRI